MSRHTNSFSNCFEILVIFTIIVFHIISSTVADRVFYDNYFIRICRIVIAVVVVAIVGVAIYYLKSLEERIFGIRYQQLKSNDSAQFLILSIFLCFDRT